MRRLSYFAGLAIVAFALLSSALYLAGGPVPTMAERPGITGLDAEIEALQLKLSKAESKLSETQEELAEAEADLAKAEAARTELEAELALAKEQARRAGSASLNVNAKAGGVATAVCLRQI